MGALGGGARGRRPAGDDRLLDGTSQRTTLPAASTVASALGTTAVYSAWGAALAVVLAIPVAMLTFRRRGTARTLLERSTYVSKALPGVVDALSLVFFTTRYVYGLYETSLLLIIAYALLGFPLALVCLRTSVAQLSPTLPDVARSLGRGPITAFVRLAPVARPGPDRRLLPRVPCRGDRATATLVLVPIGVQTLATQFWAFQQNASHSTAAPYGAGDGRAGGWVPGRPARVVV